MRTTPSEPRRIAMRALSELFLDTELTPADHVRIAAACRGAGFDRLDAEEALYARLAPKLVWSLFGVAGAWSGFDEAWIATADANPAGRLCTRLIWRPLARTIIGPDADAVSALLDPIATETPSDAKTHN